MGEKFFLNLVTLDTGWDKPVKIVDFELLGLGILGRQNIGEIFSLLTGAEMMALFE